MARMRPAMLPFEFVRRTSRMRSVSRHHARRAANQLQQRAGQPEADDNQDRRQRQHGEIAPGM